MSHEPQQQSWAWNRRIPVAGAAHMIPRFLFGMAGLAFGGGLLSFVVGIGLTDAALDAFWPQCNSAAWMRLAGGVAALIVFLSVIKWRSRWSWPQILLAIALVPVISILWSILWTFGAFWIFDPRADPILRWCCLSLAIAFGGAVWMLSRRSWPRQNG
jgi:hypothetical protein